MISNDRLEKAMTYLANSDEDAAQLRADAERAEFKARAIKDAVFLHNPDSLKTVAEREAFAGSCDPYKSAMAEYFELLAKSEAVRNKRTTESLVVDVWRSINANRRQG
jgi:hypothetical protein